MTPKFSLVVMVFAIGLVVGLLLDTPVRPTKEFRPTEIPKDFLTTKQIEVDTTITKRGDTVIYIFTLKQ